MLRVVGVAGLGILAAIFTTIASASPERWRAEGWQTDFTRSSVDLGEIISGGPPRDGIPSIDDPVFATASDIKDIADREPVIIYPLDDPRAYPLRVLIWHEIANDEVDGIPVAVTYCPLCNAAIVFDRRVGDRVLEFGTTGKLRHSDLIMYDRQTESWWQQFSGEAIAGELTGAELKLLPSRIVSFADFAQQVRTADDYGIRASAPSSDMPAVRDYIRNAIARSYQSTTPEELGNKGIDVLAGAARFVAPNAIGHTAICAAKTC